MLAKGPHQPETTSVRGKSAAAGVFPIHRKDTVGVSWTRMNAIQSALEWVEKLNLGKLLPSAKAAT